MAVDVGIHMGQLVRDLHWCGLPSFGDVVQLARTSALHVENRRFKSDRLHHADVV